MFLRMIYDEKLAQAAYLIGCEKTGEAIVIDPQRDVDRYVALAAEHGMRIVAAAETHIHADFVSGVRELAERGARAYVSGEGGEDWRPGWVDGVGKSYDHRLLRDGDTFSVGNVGFRVIHTPGHTPEHLVFLVTDHGARADAPIGVASGDFVFVGDLGRPDLLETAAGQAGAMEPAASDLFRTVRKLDEIPDFVQVWPGHGAGSACGKALGAVPMSTVGYERRFNPAIRAATDERSFIDFILSGQPEPPLYFARMKRINRDGPPVLGVLPRPARMSGADLRDVDARSVALVDTRPWDAFRAGHVPGALSLPLIRSFDTDAGSLIAENEPIVLIVEPARLDEAVRDLVRIGYDDLRGWVDPADLPGYGPGLVTVPEVDVAAARSMVDSGTPVLDVRRATEFAEGHLPDAVNVAHTRLASRLNEVPAGDRLLVNCKSGARSARAVSLLRRRGVDAVNLRGGFLAWEGAGAPVAL